jgi:hypothetical protein
MPLHYPFITPNSASRLALASRVSRFTSHAFRFAPDRIISRPLPTPTIPHSPFIIPNSASPFTSPAALARLGLLISLKLITQNSELRTSLPFPLYPCPLPITLPPDHARPAFYASD